MIGKISESTKKDADRVGLPYSDNYVFFVWKRKLKRVYFSGTRRGDAMEIHIASKNGKGMIRNAVNDFCETIFQTYNWCKRITGLVLTNNIVELAKRCGFSILEQSMKSVNGEERLLTFIERKKQWAR